MTAIKEIEQVLWVNTPLGKGIALFLIDYGIHENTIWIVALDNGGDIKHFNSNDVKLIINHTLDFNYKKEKN